MVVGGCEAPGLARPFDHVELAATAPRPLIFRGRDAQAATAVQAQTAKQKLEAAQIRYHHLCVNPSEPGRR
jgi:hypothetical protein